MENVETSISNISHTPVNEVLLAAWLRLSTSINNSRLVSDMSFNESLVCNILYHNHLEQNSPLTATDLCSRTKMLKSQMNRTLNQLENKGMIVRERSTNDKRQVYVFFNMEQAGKYKQQHQKILVLLDKIINELGMDQTKETIQIFERISDIADLLISGKGENT